MAHTKILHTYKNSLAALTILAAIVFLLPLFVYAQPAQQPQPMGYVNDFANVISPDAEKALNSLARTVQTRSGGEIAVVTLSSLQGRPVEEVSLNLGREWGVGANARVGDASRNAGTVILLVPKETSEDGRGYCRIETGMGVEGFITDSRAASICRSATERFRVQDYSGGLLIVASEVAHAYSNEFGFDLAEGELPVRRVAQRNGAEPVDIVVTLIVLVIFILLNSKKGDRSGCLPFAIVLNDVARTSGGWGGGSSGGFGGGGFGGFGGGGGFSGGGGGSSW